MREVRLNILYYSSLGTQSHYLNTLFNLIKKFVNTNYSTKATVSAKTRNGYHLLLKSALVSCVYLVSIASIYANETDAVIEVTYPKPASNEDVRDRYFYELLLLALEKSKSKFGEYRLNYSEFVIPSRRIPQEVRRGRFINVLTSPTTNELEDLMLPVKIPLVKGIQGIRILMIRESSQKLFNSLQEFKQLKTIKFGQGAGWLDAMIFRDAGLSVTTGTEYNSLFKMLDKQRFDAFPRGVNEIYRELNKWQEELPKLTAEESLVFYYDLPVYFFVKKDNQKLHERITFGLIEAQKDKSLDVLFDSYFGQALALAKLDNRKVFYLPNNYIPNIDKSKQSQFWLPFIRQNFSK